MLLSTLLVALLSLGLSHADSGEVMGCGGFVQSSKSNIDLSRIQIGFYEKRNNVLRKVESTDCAPNNGYYFLPLSPDDRGLYVLKALPPRGWKIEPQEFELQIDGETDECSMHKDLNFQFIGFGITGSILSKGSKSGPADILVELSTSDKTSVRTALTDADGKYDFFGVKPGDYIVKVSAPGLDLDVQSRVIHVGEDVGIVEPFNILGFKIDGKIIGSQSDVKFDLLEMSTMKKVGTAKSDKDGIFTFTKVPVGTYLVKLDSEMAKNLELVEVEQKVTVEHDNAKIGDFTVKSFTVYGQVTDGSKALKGVKVFAECNGAKQELVTGQDGSFVLKGVSSPPLSFKAVLGGYDFDVVNVDKVYPGMKISPLKPNRFRLSGKVDRSGFHQDITVKFSSQKEETGKVLVTEKGHFSIYLSPGEYSVSVEISSSGPAKIGFAPLEHKVKVSNAPVEGLNFQAIKADVEGKVQCIGDCASNCEVSLILEGTTVQTLAIDNKGKFKFTGVLPATYTLSITENGRCWDEPIKKVSVSKDVKDLVFKQVGRYITVDSTKATLLTIEGRKTKKMQEAVIGNGQNVICVTGTDPEVLIRTKSCEEFEIVPNILDLNSFRPLVNLKPAKYSVSGRILSKTAIPDLKMIARSEQRKIELELTKVAEGYTFNLMAYPSEEVIFQPISKNHLYEPDSLHVFVDNDCHLEVAVFNAQPGHFVQGQVTPAVEKVRIQITNPQPGLKLTEVMTDKNGAYSLGPLPKNEYKVKASKEGYVFEETAQGFNSKKLASITVKVKGQGSEDLSGVVVSVSGGQQYRSNTKSKDGTAEFLSLAPGEYFIKPQLKEYEFHPKNKMQKISEGENAVISWTAKRVAFSIFGKVVSINGQAEPGVSLRAQSKACESTEEATSETDGSIRFRGLKPGCEYVISLLHGDNIERLIPETTKVMMTEADVKLADNIVTMRAFETTDVLLKIVEEVKTVGGKALNLKVSVNGVESNYKFNTKAVTGQLIPVPRMSKDNKTYDIFVETVADKFVPQKKVSHTFKADDYVKAIKLVLNKTSTDTQKPARKVSTLVLLLPIIALALVAYFFWDQRPQFVRNLLDSSSQSLGGRRGSNDAAQVSGDSWDTTGTPSGMRKRKNKR